jgi:hypothetical protein
MQALRNAAFLARLVLAWFALSLGVAIASPVVKPQAIELICSGAGVVKVVSQGDDNGTPAGLHTLDCPLCAATGAPPAPAQGLVAMARPLGHVLQSIPAARIAALTAAPLPARGPPTPQAI